MSARCRSRPHPMAALRNVRAIRAYEKAGFVRQPFSPAEQTARYGPGDYADTVVLLQRMPP